MSMIEFSGVNLTYQNGVEALKDINLFIDNGEFVFLMGPTGSGKSSLIKLIYREELPNSGEVYINNHDVTELLKPKIPILRRKIGVVFQDFKLLDYKTVGENVAYALEVTGYETSKIPERVDMVLTIVGMIDKKNRYPDEISGGEKQLTSIARALAHNPPVLLADEPTGNLDPVSSINIIEILDYINSKGTTVLIATHDLAIVKHLKNKRIIMMEDSKISSDTKPASDVAPADKIAQSLENAANNITKPEKVLASARATVEIPALEMERMRSGYTETDTKEESQRTEEPAKDNN